MSRPDSRFVVAVCAVALLGAACSPSEAAPGAADTPSASLPTSATPTTGGEQAAPGPAVVTVAPAAGTDDARPDQPVTVSVTSGSITRLTVKTPESDEPLKGTYSADRTKWTGQPQLKPGADYTVTGTATGTDGKAVPISSSFSTLPANLRLKASVSPIAGTKVGVGMPIMVFWNHPVQDKAAVARRLKVTTSVPVEGTWHWNDDKQVNWRPKTFWPANTKVSLDVDTQGVKAGEGLWGWANRHIEFEIGSSVISYIDVTRHTMTVTINGATARQIPITAGKAGFTTRSGIKLIMEKYRVKRMDARTVGIQPGDPDYYDIHDVQYAHRVTSSGEFVHGAPWSAGSQGSENVSHGCVGMSLKNAAWYFGQTHVGDPVIVTGTSRKIEPGNGWTDWDMSWDKYKAGSALS
jgi:lipoprotein-anchoring transpeptidase ErfK/SrfK